MDKGKQDIIDLLIGKTNSRDIKLYNPVFNEAKRQLNAQRVVFPSLCKPVNLDI